MRAAPDGYTLLLAGSYNAINVTLYDKLNFNFIRDIAPVASIVSQPQVMLVNPSFPARSVSEFVAYAKANPGKINYASTGIGTPQHVAGELFKVMAGVNLVHVPYRGAAPAASCRNCLRCGSFIVPSQKPFCRTSLPASSAHREGLLSPTRVRCWH